MIQEGIAARLLADSGVGAIAGANVYVMLAPDDSQANYPCVSYSFVGGSEELTLRNHATRHQRVELNALAFNYGDAARLREAIIVALEDWKEVLSDGTDVIGTFVATTGIDFTGEDRIVRCLVEFYVDYNSPT